MPIRDFIANFEYDPNTFNFEEFKAKAIGEFDSDHQAWDAKVNQLTTEQERLSAENEKVKAKNWDLFQQLPAQQPKEVQGGGPDDAKETPPPSIDSFFGKE